MTEKISVYRKIECLITNSGMAQTNGIRPQESDLGLEKNAALVFSDKKGVLWTGPDKNLPKKFRAARNYNCQGLVAYPGLIDSHTHPAFGGNRAKEFSMRMAGASYQEIAQAGGGILSTMKATRALSVKSLSALVQARLQTAYDFGVRVLEAKSGYGLDLKSETNALAAITAAEKNFKKIRVVKTCMAAHAVPPEFQGNRGAWVDHICAKILPLVQQKKLASFVDVFSDQGYFSPADTRKIFSTAHELGLNCRLHGDELANTGSAELAAELGAASVDHLLKISDAGIRALASSSTIATLLPGTSLFLREIPAPARKLIDSGVAVALATDFNPGTCTTQNLPFIATLAAVQLNMTTAEIIAAITWNAARALCLEKAAGALLPGYITEPVFAEGDHPAAIYYKLAAAKLVIPPRA